MAVPAMKDFRFIGGTPMPPFPAKGTVSGLASPASTEQHSSAAGFDKEGSFVD